jgi:hypothetical protein
MLYLAVPQVLAGIGLPRDPAAFYQQLHSYLASLGIDGVKVDVQVGVGAAYWLTHDL